MGKHLEKELRVDHRHLVLFFLGAVIVCASFFALGFVVGRVQIQESTLVGTNRTESARLQLSGSGKVIPTKHAKVGAIQGQIEPPSLKERHRRSIKTQDYRTELDFYSAVKDQIVNDNFRPGTDHSKKAKKVKSELKKKPKNRAPKPIGLLRLQVASVIKKADAERLAQKLRVKGYPVLVVSPSKEESPQWIRVQVGPFKSPQKTAAVKIQLAKDGYESFLRR